MIRNLVRVGAFLAAGYGFLVLAFFLLQRRFQYFPDRSTEAAAVRRASALGLAPWRDGEGRLIGWRPGRPAPLRLLIFHGNAGNALDRAYYLRLADVLGAEAVLMEYRGYGARPGEVSEAALVQAGRETASLLAREGRMVVLGESLGSGVAVQVAATRPMGVRGLLLVTPYASMADLGAEIYPWLPVRLLLRDRWDSETAIRGYAGPVAVILAGRDEVVGAAQGRRLVRACPGPARIWEQPEAGHNTLDLSPNEGGWAEAFAFVSR